LVEVVAILGEGLALVEDFPLITLEQLDQQALSCGLAGAAGAEETEDFPVSNLKIYSIDSTYVTFGIPELQVLYLKQWQPLPVKKCSILYCGSLLRFICCH